MALHPREALERVKKKVMEDANEVSAKMDRLSKSDSLRELEKLYKDNIKTVKPEDLTGALKGRQALMQQLETMLKKAKKSVKLLTTEAGMVEIAQQHIHLFKKASEAGVKIQIAAPITKQTEQIAKDLAKYAQVRDIDEIEYIEHLAGRLAVVDSQEFLVGLSDDTKVHPTQDVSFWTQSDHATANMFEPMFELVWRHAKPVK